MSRPHFAYLTSVRIVFVVLTVLLLLEKVTPQTTTLGFDELPNNTVIADQYLNAFGVRFTSGNPFSPVHTYQNCGPCSTTSPPNFISTKPDDSAAVTVDFTYRVSNLTFYMIGVDAFFNQFATIDVYRDGAFYNTYPVFGNGTFTVGFTFGSINNITKIVIRNINDASGI